MKIIALFVAFNNKIYIVFIKKNFVTSYSFILFKKFLFLENIYIYYYF